MRFRPRRVDKSQAEIVAALRKHGAFVVDLSAVGRGVPDLLVWTAARGWGLVECKSPGRKTHESKAKRALQEAFRVAVKIATGVEVPVVETSAEALARLGLVSA